MISLPRLDYAGRATRTIEAVCLVGAATLLIVNVIRLTGTRALLRWWVHSSPSPRPWSPT